MWSCYAVHFCIMVHTSYIQYICIHILGDMQKINVLLVLQWYQKWGWVCCFIHGYKDLHGIYSIWSHSILVSHLWVWSGRKGIIDEKRKGEQLDHVLAQSRGAGIWSRREGFSLSWEHRQLIHNDRSDGGGFWHSCYCVSPCGWGNFWKL